MQGVCGSCYAFGSYGCLEAHNNKYIMAQGNFDIGKPVDLSPQEVVDCGSEFGNLI